MKKLIAALILLASPAIAQDRMTPEHCAQSQIALFLLIDLQAEFDESTVDDEGWCHISDLVVSLDNTSGVRIGTLRWRASDIARFIDDGLPPRALDIEGTALAALARTGDDVFDYLLALQMNQSKMSFGASLRWDGVQQIVNLNSAFFEFDEGNRIEASARIEGANLTDMATIQMSAGNAGLRNVMVKAQFDGWFETYVAMTLGTMLLSSRDATPQAQVAELKRKGAEILNTFPTDILPDPSRDALIALMNSLPTPRGTFQAQLSADPAIGAVRAARIATLAPDAPVSEIIETSFDGVTALFTWAPTETPQ